MRKGHGVIVIDSMLAMKNWKRRTSSLHSYVSQYPCHLQFSIWGSCFSGIFPEAQRRARLILPASVAPDGTRKALMRT